VDDENAETDGEKKDFLPSNPKLEFRNPKGSIKRAWKDFAE
jgi:hypothetical protein